MEFHLVYAGDLLRSSGNSNRRTWEKHSIRRHLHAQMKKLWETHPALKSYAAKTVAIGDDGVHLYPEKPFLEVVAKTYEKSGVGFIPLITEPNGLVCSLDILFLRPDKPGSILGSAGDIDNRIKCLLPVWPDGPATCTLPFRYSMYCHACGSIFPSNSASTRRGGPTSRF
jgi:hypothetical protein